MKKIIFEFFESNLEHEFKELGTLDYNAPSGKNEAKRALIFAESIIENLKNGDSIKMKNCVVSIPKDFPFLIRARIDEVYDYINI